MVRSCFPLVFPRGALVAVFWQADTTVCSLRLADQLLALMPPKTLATFCSTWPSFSVVVDVLATVCLRHSEASSRLIALALQDKSLAFVCYGCSRACVRVSRGAERWTSAVSAGVIQANDDTNWLVGRVRRCSKRAFVDTVGVSWGLCRPCYASSPARARAAPPPPPQMCEAAPPSNGWRAVSVCGVQEAPAEHTLFFEQRLPSVNIAPRAGIVAMTAALRAARLSYASLEGPQVAEVAQLVKKHLTGTRPDEIVVTFANGRRRKYARVYRPAKDKFGPRQVRRRAALAATTIGRLFAIDPGMLAASMADAARRAQASGGIAVAPAAVLAALPVRLQNQFLMDNGVSGSLWRRFRLLLGPIGADLATGQTLRADRRAAEAELRNAATTNGEGAFLVAPRVALQSMIDDLVATEQFVERFERGADGADIATASPFLGHPSPTEMRAADVRCVQVCFGLDKGGAQSTTKAVLSCVNQERPCSRGNTLLYGVFPAAEDDHAALSAMADVYVPDLDTLRMGGVDVDGVRRAVQLILTGDYQFTTTWCGHLGVSRKMPCQRCTAMMRLTKTNGELIAIYGNMQNGSRAGGKPRTIDHFK